MSIWGRRDSEPPTEETQQSQGEAHGEQEPAAEHQAEEPAPAFWRAQGQTPASLGRDPADAPPPSYEHVPDSPPPAGVPATTTMGPTPAYGQQAAGEPAEPAATESAEPAASEAPDGTGAPGPGHTGVVVDGETAVKDPALTGPAVTEVPEPTMAVPREPVVNEAQVPAVPEPSGEAGEPVMVEAQELAGTEAREPAVTPAQAGAHDPGTTAQRWSEILAGFVDDPRGSVKMAADAVDETIDEFVNSVRSRQRDLASTWQGADADTERLRTALLEYRRLGQRVRQLDIGGTTGA